MTPTTNVFYECLLHLFHMHKWLDIFQVWLLRLFESRNLNGVIFNLRFLLVSVFKKKKKHCRVEVSTGRSSSPDNSCWLTAAEGLCENYIFTCFWLKLLTEINGNTTDPNKTSFYEKYFICKDCRQLKLARSLPYLSLSIEPTLKVTFLELFMQASAKIRTIAEKYYLWNI